MQLCIIDGKEFDVPQLLASVQSLPSEPPEQAVQPVQDQLSQQGIGEADGFVEADGLAEAVGEGLGIVQLCN